MRPIMFELGGKDAALVLEDADLNALPTKSLREPLAIQANVARAIKRVIVLECSRSISYFASGRVAKLTVGDPFDNADITPVIDNASADFIWGLIEMHKKRRAQALRQSNVKAIFWPVLLTKLQKI